MDVRQSVRMSQRNKVNEILDVFVMVGKLFSTNRLFVKSQREDSGPHRAIEYHHAFLHDVFQFVGSVIGHGGI